jgi:hypothetical protein
MRTPLRPAREIYVNFVRLGFNAFEFLFDLGTEFPDSDPVTIDTRVITNPADAKAFAQMLLEAIIRYEEKFGPISDSRRS